MTGVSLRRCLLLVVLALAPLVPLTTSCKDETLPVKGQLMLSVLGRGTAWLDTGSPDSLLQASHFIQTVEARQGLKIGCLEEIAFRMGFIDLEALRSIGESLQKTEYGRYLLQLASELRTP